MPRRGRPAENQNNNRDDYLQEMPIASALTQNDTDEMQALLSSFLPRGEVSNVKIEKSIGEAFTGGRSTPVYYITCQITLQQGQVIKERHFVAKLVEMPDDDNVNVAKLQMKRESYAVERRFYSVVASRLKGCSLEIPRLIASDGDGSKPRAAVCFLMNDVRQRGFTEHPDVLNVSKCKQALQYLAKFHAIFWGDGSKEAWRRDLWNRGGFWTDGKDFVDETKIASQWNQTYKWLQTNNHIGVDLNAMKSLGKRIQDIAKPLSKFLLTESKGCRGTMIHGDYKAANLFFKPSHNKDSEEENDGFESVAAVDFQFAGAGIGAEDVSYILFPDARGYFKEDEEEELLIAYHEQLVSDLIQERKGGPSSLPYDTFKAYYELSKIDFTRHLLGRGWVASTKGDVQLVNAVQRTMIKIDEDGKNLTNEKEYIDRLSSFVFGSSSN